MGGGQLYVRNKVDYLQKKGWEVSVFVGRCRGPLLIQELKQYEENYYPELNDNPFNTSFWHRKKIINEIISSVKGFNTIVIETSELSLALWGELIGKKIEAKHVFLCFNDEFPAFEHWQYEFLNFKHLRKELAGIGPKSMQKIFGSYKQIAEGENYYLRFMGLNHVSSLSNSYMATIKKGDICIGCIAQLHKPFVMPMIQEIILFASFHTSKKISFILIGDVPMGMERIKLVIQNSASVVKNLTLYMPGYMSPIPRQLLEIADVFVGTAGAIKLTACNNKISIGLDTITGQVIGIVGYDTQSALYADDQEHPPLHEYLDYVLFKLDKKPVMEKLSQLTPPDYMKEFDNHMKFIEDSCPKKAYYRFADFTLKDRLEFFQKQREQKLATRKRTFRYSLGKTLSFLKKGRAIFYCLSGFSLPEQTYTWTDGTEAEMKFVLRGKHQGNLLLNLEYGTFNGPQHVRLYAGKILVADYVANGDETKTFEIPQTAIDGAILLLRFELPDAVSPAELGLSSDGRRLALAMKSMSILLAVHTS